MIWGGCKNRVVVGLNLSISSLFVHVHSLCYSTSIKRSGRVPLCSQTLPRMTASCSGLPQLPDRVVIRDPTESRLASLRGTHSAPTKRRRKRIVCNDDGDGLGRSPLSQFGHLSGGTSRKYQGHGQATGSIDTRLSASGRNVAIATRL